jgi:hypothetical protein
MAPLDAKFNFVKRRAAERGVHNSTGKIRPGRGLRGSAARSPAPSERPSRRRRAQLALVLDRLLVAAEAPQDCGFEVAVTGEMEVNPTLLQMLQSEFNYRVDPEELLSEAGIEGSVDALDELDAIRVYVDPAAAGYQLAKRITGLPDGLVALIGGDQITDSAILGCPVPEPVQPILRAVDDRSELVLQVPDMAAPEPIIDTTPPKEEFAEALRRLLQGRNARIRPRKLPPQLRSRLQAL